MIQQAFTLLFLFLFLGSMPTDLSAESVSIGSYPTFQEGFDDANLIFKGELVDIQSNWVSGGYKLVFHVEESWKRTTEEYTTANLAKGEGCLDKFVKGSNYLVYIRKKFNLKVFCSSRSRLLSEASDDLVSLGNGLPPSQSPGTQKLPIIMTLLTIGGLILVAIVVLRKGRKK